MQPGQEEEQNDTQRSKKGQQEKKRPRIPGTWFQKAGKRPEAIKLKQTVLPTLADRKRKDRQRATPGEARKLCPGKKKTYTHTQELAFQS